MKWTKVCKTKKGALGIKDLRKMNISLLCKWWWRLEKGEGLWQEIVKKKTHETTLHFHAKEKANELPCLE